jgi:hypothetical protein
MTPIIFGTRFYFATKPESVWRRLPPERFRLWQQVVRLAPGHCGAALIKDLQQIAPWCVPLENGPLEGRLRPPKRPIAPLQKKSLRIFFRIRAVEIV